LSVTLVRGDSHYKTTFRALEMLKEELEERLETIDEALIKPNLVSSWNKYANTHHEALEATIDFLDKYVNRIVVGEAPAGGNFKDRVRKFGYISLEERGVEFMDLCRDSYRTVRVFDSDLERRIEVRLSRTVLEAQFRVSLTVPKTHDAAIVTLSIKNMAVGSIICGDKWNIHRGPTAINLNIALIALYTMPHLSIIDGYTAMEGNGPINGEQFIWGIGGASLTPLSMDSLMAHLMGFNPTDVGYLYYLDKWGVSGLSEYKILGIDPERVRRSFRPHSGIEHQRKWRRMEIARPRTEFAE